MQTQAEQPQVRHLIKLSLHNHSLRPDIPALIGKRQIGQLQTRHSNADRKAPRSHKQAQTEPSLDRLRRASKLRPDRPALTRQRSTDLPSADRTSQLKPDSVRRNIQAQTGHSAHEWSISVQTYRTTSDRTSKVKPDILVQSRQLQTTQTTPLHVGRSSQDRTATKSRHPDSDQTCQHRPNSLRPDRPAQIRH